MWVRLPLELLVYIIVAFTPYKGVLAMTKTTLIIAALSFYISIHSLLGFASEPRRMDFLMKTKPKTKLVLFSANWCLPCKMINKWIQEDKIIKDLLSKYDIEHYDFDVDKKSSSTKVCRKS